MNIFAHATRQQFRFPSIKGLLTTEDLWQLPLQSKTGFDLDSVAKSVNRELKATGEESFVETITPANTQLQMMMDIVKHVISVKKDENETARNAAARKAEREKLMGILADKQDAALKDLSPEEIQKRLAELV